MDGIKPDYVTVAFVRAFRESIERDGVVTDEQGVGPPGPRMNADIDWIREELSDAGFDCELATRFVAGVGDEVGFVYLIYDVGRFADAKHAEEAAIRVAARHRAPRAAGA